MSASAAAGMVRRFLDARVGEGRIPGATWWIEGPDGASSHGAVGWAALEPEREKAAAETPYDLASLTKPLVTALLLVLLEQDGRVDPARPVADALDEFHDSHFGRASLLDLARHEAGLPAWRPTYLAASDLSGYLRCIAAEPAVAPHGETLYSDLGYIALGAALERLTGETLDRLFAARVARPLGLPRAGFAVAGRGFGDAAATERGNRYERDLAGAEGSHHAWRRHPLRGEVHDANAHALGGVAGHAGLFATVAEVASIVREIAEPGFLGLGERARARLLAPARSGARTVGLQLAAQSQSARGVLAPDAAGHTGFTGTSFWLDARRGEIYVLLTNRVHPIVGPRSFQWLRRGFHRAARLARRDR